MQEQVEEAVGDALHAEVRRCTHGALRQAWAPEDPLPEGLSPWMAALIKTLDVRL